jgi:hypothetical protein
MDIVETCELLCLYLSDFGFQNVRHVLDKNYWKMQDPDLRRHLMYGTYKGTEILICSLSNSLNVRIPIISIFPQDCGVATSRDTVRGKLKSLGFQVTDKL